MDVKDLAGTSHQGWDPLYVDVDRTPNLSFHKAVDGTSTAKGCQEHVYDLCLQDGAHLRMDPQHKFGFAKPGLFLSELVMGQVAAEPTARAEHPGLDPIYSLRTSR